MKTTVKSLMLAAALGALAANLSAGSTSLGGAYASDGEGARALGMGGAFVAVADDANANWANPAGMAFFTDHARYASFTHSMLYQVDGLSRDYLAYAQADDGGYGALGVSWDRFTADLNPETYTEDTFAYSGAKRLASTLPMAVGWTLKYFRVASSLAASSDNQTVGAGDATGFGADLGLMFKPAPSVAVGVDVQNLYSSLSWDTHTYESIPTVANGGIAWHMNERTVFAAQASMAQSSSGYSPQTANAGGEIWMFDGKTEQWGFARNIALRAGYQQALANNDAGQVDAGASIKAETWQLDYAFQYMLTQSELGNTQRLGLSFSF